MTSTKNHVFDSPPPVPHASTWAGPPLPLVDVIDGWPLTAILLSSARRLAKRTS